MSQGKSAPPASLFAHLCNCILDFVSALESETLSSCTLKKPNEVLPSTNIGAKINTGNGIHKSIETSLLLSCLHNQSSLLLFSTISHFVNVCTCIQKAPKNVIYP